MSGAMEEIVGSRNAEDQQDYSLPVDDEGDDGKPPDSEPERSIVPPGQTLPNGSISLFVPQQTGTDAEGNAISGPPPSPFTLKSALSAATSLQTVGSRFTNAKRTVSWADLTAGAALTTVVEFERDQPSSPHSEASWEEDAYNDSRCCCLVM